MRDSVNHGGRQSRPTSAAPRGRGRNRGNQRGSFNRPINRVSLDSDYADYPTEYTQVSVNLKISIIRVINIVLLLILASEVWCR